VSRKECISVLSSKMKVAIRSEKFVKLSGKHVSFYIKYASIVFKSLRKPLFQKFLRWMLKRENIGDDMVSNVQVRVFPFQKRNGNSLAGKCNAKKGEIRIYPKKLEFCRKLKQKFGKEKVRPYIKNRAKAALIHELLHLKYLDDEEKVRELTRKYFIIFSRHQENKNSNANIFLRMLFKQ